MAKAKLPESQLSALEEGDIGEHPGEEVTEETEFADLNQEDETPAPEPKKKAKKAVDDGEGDDIPAELKGKSPKELAKMYREAQSLIGRQGSELGEYRKHVDKLIQSNLESLKVKAAPAAEKAAPAEESEAEFFAKPREAIAKAIANDPIIQEIRNTLGKTAETQAIQRATGATERFQAAHPDAPEIMADPDFRAWVGASRVRSELLHRAHTQYDFDSGDEIFGTWKALRGINVAKEEAAAEDAAAKDAAKVLAKRKAALRDAAAPSDGGGTVRESGSKKIYRRADVIKLMEEDYDRYEALAPEIEQAYREGRVR